MVKVYPLTYAPDLDCSWSVNPGYLEGVSNLAPLQDGHLASVGLASPFAPASSDVLAIRMFRQSSGSVRLLVFRKGDIDEYDSAYTKTNRVTGLSASTTGWEAAAWGNQIIAVNYLNVPQSSTSAAFSNLSGSPPKARYVAANLNFVMFADVDDGGSNVFADMVWWSALQDPTSWTPSIATQCGNYRLLDAPGPITALVAYRDTFIAFKDSSIFIGEYIGPPYVISWRMVSNKVGCSAPKSVVEVDGKLYFCHASGFYEFDGQSLRNIGIPVFRTFLTEIGISQAAYTRGTSTFPSVRGSFSWVQAAGDDSDGNVLFLSPTGSSSNYQVNFYCYNARCQKWGRANEIISLDNNLPILAKVSYADMVAFSSTLGDVRAMYCDNRLIGYQIKTLTYPGSTATATQGGFGIIPGMIGQTEGSKRVIRYWPRTIYPSDSAAFSSVTARSYATEDKSLGVTTTSAGTLQTEFQSLDCNAAGKFVNATISQSTTGKKVVLGGLGIEFAEDPSRR